MSGSVFLASGWSVGGISSAINNHEQNYQHVNGQHGRNSGRRTASGAVSQRGVDHRFSLVGTRGFRGVVTTVLALAGVRTRFQRVDYRNFRELLNFAIGGRVRSWGRDTYLYDDRNQVIAIKRAARFDASGRCVPPSYFVRRAA